MSSDCFKAGRIALTTLICAAASHGALAADAPGGACPKDESGLKLSPGFCATVFADGLGHVRHMVVAPSGVLYVNTWSGEYYGENDKLPEGGFLVALQDKASAGKADKIERFGETSAEGGGGGTGIGIHAGHLYAEIGDRIVRYPLPAQGLVPQGKPEIIVKGLPLTGEHPMHPFAIGADGSMYVDVASATNACQEKNRELESRGLEPCKELETRAGIWRYDANKAGQKFSAAERYVTGIRNAGGIAIDAGGAVFATQHGRDQLGQNWPKLYTPEQGATLPAEVMLHIEKGGDYGWPRCYYDGVQGKLVLAPEYGGDGGKAVGLCANKRGAAAAFPAHWAPNALQFYQGKQFPSRYRAGAFIAFHGSWNRAPFRQDGYNVVFQPMANGKAAPGCEIFADGFAGKSKSPEDATHRPSGLAVGQDGALFISDDVRGRIYRVTYRGNAGAAYDATRVTACPGPTALAGSAAPQSADASGEADLPLPPGVTRETVALGSKLYHGEVVAASCVGCHGSAGKGTPLGPDLTKSKLVWSDGSVAGIAGTITHGVAQPKSYRNPMPALGGAQLTPDQVSAIAAYVWALGHSKR